MASQSHLKPVISIASKTTSTHTLPGSKGHELEPVSFWLLLAGFKVPRFLCRIMSMLTFGIHSTGP